MSLMIPVYSFAKSPNFSPGRTRPVSALVLHFTGSPSTEVTVRWFQNPSARVSTHYVVGRDGSIVQMVLEQDTAWHAGKSSLAGDPNVNSMSIGIEIVNWGELVRKGNEFFCWPAKNTAAPMGHQDRDFYTRPYSTSQFGEPKFAVGKWWAPYSMLQIVAVTKMCSEICKRYPAITRERIVGHEDVAPGRKDDPGPLLDILDIRRAVERSRSDSAVAKPATGDDIGDDQLYASQDDRAGE